MTQRAMHVNVQRMTLAAAAVVTTLLLFVPGADAQGLFNDVYDETMKKAGQAQEESKKDKAARIKAERERAEAKRQAAEAERRANEAEAKVKEMEARLKAQAGASAPKAEAVGAKPAVAVGGGAAVAPASAGVPGASRQVGEKIKDCEVCPELVVIPPGSFMMGSPAGEVGRYGNEGPPHRVTINYRLAVGKYKVAFDEWDACAREGGCNGNPKPEDRGWGRGKRPVINVSWNYAQEYIAWVNGKAGLDKGEAKYRYRLLTEAEWEYAARAGSTGRWSFGDDESQLKDHAWYGYEMAGKQTHPVGEKRPNAFGLYDLYDLYGNVWEWVQDCYKDSYEGVPVDGSAWEPVPVSPTAI